MTPGPDNITRQIEDLKEENKKLKQHVQILEKLLELNMKDLHDIADQRDWYYDEYRKIKDDHALSYVGVEVLKRMKREMHPKLKDEINKKTIK